MAVGSKRNAKIEITTDASKMDPGLAEARKKMRNFERDVKAFGGTASKIASMPLKAGKAIGGAVLGGLGIQAAGGITGMLGDILNVEKAFTRLQITGEMSTSQLQSFRDEVKRVSAATGLGREQILEGASSYVALTGDAQGAQNALQVFAEVAQGSGASMADIASTAAALRDNMGIDPKDFRPAFDILVKQGHLGAVEIKDLATQMASLAPMFAHFSGGKTLHGLAEAGAAAQVIRKEFGNADEMGTGFRDAMSDMVKNAKKLRAHGVEIFTVDPKTKQKVLRDFFDIMSDIKKSDLAKDPELLQKVFGEIRGRRAIDALLNKLDQAKELMSTSEGSDQVAKDNAIYQESAAGKIERAWNNVKLAMADAFSPDRITALAGALGSVTDGLVSIIKDLKDVQDWIEAHQAASKEELAAGAAKAADKMTPEQKKAYADELETSGQTMNAVRSSNVAGISVGDVWDWMGGNNDALKGDWALDAAKQVRMKAAGTSRTTAQIAAEGGMNVDLRTGNVKGIVDALTAALKGITIVVKTDGSQIGKTIDNSQQQGTRPGGH